MSSASAMLASDKLNLEKIHFLLVDDSFEGLNMLRQVITGFGARRVSKCQSVAQAKDIMQNEPVDFVLTDGQMPGEDGYEFIRWIRSEAKEPNRFVPAILLTGHTRRSQVLQARDCGAHFIIAKPLIPQVLLERIYWVAKDERMFIDGETYKGPDRRFQQLGPPAGMEGRREEDRKASAAKASEPADEADTQLKVQNG